MVYFGTGLILIVVSWVLAWTQVSALAAYKFFPLWVGYILAVNGLSELLHKDSLIKRLGWRWFVFLFFLSIPLWWMFEGLNIFVQNWQYLIPSDWSHTTEIVMKTISFSIVIPATWSTALFVSNFLKRLRVSRFWPLPETAWLEYGTFATGILSLILIVLYPVIFFPLVWLAPLFILDPINRWLGYESVLQNFYDGKWLTIVSFSVGTLTTGVFWEMWNFYALPKWVYTIPYLDFWHIFELPFFGYFGYLPFGLIVFTVTSLAFGALGKLQLFKTALPISR